MGTDYAQYLGSFHKIDLTNFTDLHKSEKNLNCVVNEKTKNGKFYI